MKKLNEIYFEKIVVQELISTYEKLLVSNLMVTAKLFQPFVFVYVLVEKYIQTSS